MIAQTAEIIYEREREDWDRNAAFYRCEGSSPLMRLLAQRREDFYQITPGQRVLDVGCGAGGTVAQLRRRGVEAVGIDFSPAMIEAARSEHGLGSLVQYADATALPFGDGTFDAVIVDGVLHHLAVQQQLSVALREFHRVLRPGGHLCCFDRNGSLVSAVLLAVSINIKELIRLVTRQKLYPSSATRQEIPFGGRRDQEVIAKCGFTSVRQRNVASAPFFMSVVVMNAIQYFISERWRRAFESTVCRLLRPIEDHCTWRWFCVERVAVLQSRPSRSDK